MNIKSSNSPGKTASYEFNVRLMLATLLLVGIVGTGSYFWYQFAFEKSAIGFLSQARSTYETAEPLIDDPDPEARANGLNQAKKAFELYWQYIQIQPADFDALLEFAERYDQTDLENKNYRRAVVLFQRVIVQFGPQPKYVASLAGNLVEMGEYGEAEKQSVRLIGELGADGADNSANESLHAIAWRSLARSILGQFHQGILTKPNAKDEVGLASGDVLTKAIDLNPNDWKLGFSIAEFWLLEESQKFLSEYQNEELARRGIDRIAYAIELAGQVLGKNNTDPNALCDSYLFKRNANVDQPEIDLNEAIRIAPSNPRANAMLGEFLFESVAKAVVGRPANEITAEQRSVLERSRDMLKVASPESGEVFAVHSGLGQVYQLLGDNDQAVATWKKGLEINSNQEFELRYRIVEYLVKNDQLAEADLELSAWNDRITGISLSPNPNPKLIFSARSHRVYWLGQIQLKRNQIDQALQSFDFVLINDSIDKYHSRIARLSLGNWFESRNLLQEAVNQYEAALTIAPEDDEIRLACARANSRAGNWKPAQRHYLRVFEGAESADLKLEYANVLLQVELTRLPSERNWNAVDAIIAQLRSPEFAVNPSLAELVERLATNVEVVKGDSRDSFQSSGLQSQLERLEQIDSNSPTHVNQLARVLAFLGENEKLEDLIQKRLPQIADEFERTKLAVEIRMRRQDEGDLATCLDLIARLLPTITDNEHKIDLNLLLTNVLVAQREYDLALERLTSLHNEFSDSSRVLMELVDFVIRLDRIEGSPMPWESGLAEFEGQNGSIQQFLTARRKIQQVDDFLKSSDAADSNLLTGQLKVLDEGKALMSKVIGARPNWPKGYEQLGVIHQLASSILLQLPQKQSQARSESQNAVSQYRRAWEVGGRDLSLVYRLVFLDSDPEFIKGIFEMLDSRTVSAVPGLAGRNAEVALHLNDMPMAERIAKELVETRPEDPISWLISGQVQARQGDFEKANEAAEKARLLIKKDSDERESLLKVFQFYITSALWQNDPELRAKQMGRAVSMIASLVNLEEPESKDFFKAQLLAAVDDPQAATFFQSAENNNPREAQLLLILDYYLQDSGSVDSLVHAIRLAEKLVQKYPFKNEYKLQLASLLMRRGLGDDFDVARKLLQESAVPGTFEFNRAEAIRLVQIQRMLPNFERLQALSEAERLMRAVTDPPNSSNSEDRFLLAEIYLGKIPVLEPGSEEQVQNADRLRAIIDSLDQAPGLNANQIANLANFYINEQKDVEKAQKNLDRLNLMTRSASPPFGAPYQLQIRLWKANGDPDLPARTKKLAGEFESRIQQGALVYDAMEKSRMFTEMALIYQEAGDSENTLDWLRKAVAINPDQTNNLILALAQNNQKLEAVKVARALYEKNPKIDLIRSVVFILGSGQTPTGAFDAAKPLLDDAVKRFANDQDLLMTVGDYYAFQPNMAATSIQYYRQALALAGTKPLTTLSLLNNLATVLGEGDQQMRSEAIQLIDRAEGMLQNRNLPPALLDTKAIILMNDGNLEQSRKILRGLVASDKDPRFWFHLAEVEWKFAEVSGLDADRQSFQTALKNAIDGGVEDTVLTPGELERLIRLKQNRNANPDAGPSE